MTGPAISIAEFAHPRVADSCAALYLNGHYPQAAFEAMKQVELALREVSLAPKKLPARLVIHRVFGGFRGLHLAVPAGPEYQRHAQNLFDGAFGYYRNYGAHEGDRIDKKTCIRILALASELLDLLLASERLLPSIEGVEGLVEAGLFSSTDEFRRCLEFFEYGHDCTDEVFDGYWEDLALAGISEEQERLLWDLGLVETNSRPFPERRARDLHDYIELIELSTFGRSLLEEVKQNTNASTTVS